MKGKSAIEVARMMAISDLRSATTYFRAVLSDDDMQDMKELLPECLSECQESREAAFVTIREILDTPDGEW